MNLNLNLNLEMLTSRLGSSKSIYEEIVKSELKMNYCRCDSRKWGDVDPPEGIDLEKLRGCDLEKVARYLRDNIDKWRWHSLYFDVEWPQYRSESLSVVFHNPDEFTFNIQIETTRNEVPEENGDPE